MLCVFVNVDQAASYTFLGKNYHVEIRSPSRSHPISFTSYIFFVFFTIWSHGRWSGVDKMSMSMLNIWNRANITIYTFCWYSEGTGFFVLISRYSSTSYNRNLSDLMPQVNSIPRCQHRRTLQYSGIQCVVVEDTNRQDGKKCKASSLEQYLLSLVGQWRCVGGWWSRLPRRLRADQ